jgi:toxin HigB-1
LGIAFATKRLRQLCESEATARNALGDKVARKLRARLADLSAALSVKDLVAGSPREMSRDGTQVIAINLSGGARLLFTANHASLPMANRGVDWSKVTRVKVICIEDGDDRD